MPAGKVAAQAAHGFLDSYIRCLKTDPERAKAYRDFSNPEDNEHGIKVCLKAKNLEKLIQIEQLCLDSGIPNALVHDLGYTCFEGRETITALGIGPVRKSELPKAITKLQIL